jgi:Putative Flp pilus-assembly TadE/G-like
MIGAKANRMQLSPIVERTAGPGSRGQVLPLVGLALVVLMGVAALAIDVGYWRYNQRVQQTAADSAAIAGASEIASGSAGVTAAAKADAALNGFTDDGVNVNVQVHWPPSSGSYTANASAVEVIVQANHPNFFARVLGFASQSVSARAVAAVNTYNRNCIYGLSTTATSVLFNGSTVNAPRCGIISNNNMTINGATVTAWMIGYAGTDIDNGSTYHSAHPAHTLAVSDPCATTPGCAYIKAHPPTTGSCMSPTTYNGLSTATLWPGRYCSNVIINGCTNVVFQPGVYDFDNGLTANGVSNVSGSGVTIYNNSGSLVINGSTVSLSAPSSGNYEGVLFFQNPADSNPFVVNGSSGSGFAGMIYFPSSQITVNGTLSQWLFIVGNTIVINGAGTNVPDASFPGAGHAVLAE